MKFKPNYVILPLVVFGVLWLGSLITRGNMAWYATLTLPKLMPREVAFPIAWNTIGLLTSVSLLLFYNRAERGFLFWVIMGLFGANGLLNLAWTKAFFGWHTIALAWFIALALEFNLLALISLMYRRHKLAAVLLVPYALWVLFALYLNWRLWILN